MNALQTPTAIGRYSDGGDAFLDVGRLVGSHLCIQANSGGGKSGAIRRLLEITHGQLQHIVLDVEDEFHTLREKFAYMIAGGENGDCAATVNNAGALALMILETGYSAIVQLNDLHIEERRDFIAAFLGALIGAPKALWHPALVVLDEAQMYAPQVGVVSSSDAVVSLMTLGRKRGFTGVLAAPRIAGISKDAIGAVNNWLLGRIGQPVDRKASADALGFGSNSAEARGLIELETGQFYGYGPALCRAPALIQIGEAATTYIKAGMAPVPVPPAPAAMRQMLERMNKAAKEADVPAVAAAAATATTDLGATGHVRMVGEGESLAKLAAATAAGDAAGYKRGHDEGYLKGIASGRRHITGIMAELQTVFAASLAEAERLCEKAYDESLDPDFRETAIDNSDHAADVKMLQTMSKLRGPEPKPSKLEKPRAAAAARTRPDAAGGLPGPQQRIVNSIAFWRSRALEQPTNAQTAWLAGYSPSSTSFTNPRSALKSAGLIDYPAPDHVSLTDAGHAASVPLQISGSLLDFILQKLTGPEARILESIAKHHPKAIDNETAASGANYSATSTSYTNPRSSLRTKDLITYPSQGQVRAADWLLS